MADAAAVQEKPPRRKRNWTPVLVVAAIVSTVGVSGLAVAAGGVPSTGTATVCATATTPAQTVNANGVRVGIIKGAAATNCATVTYTVPTVTETTPASTVTVTVTDTGGAGVPSTTDVTTTAPDTTTAPPVYSASRFVYCFGDPAWTYNGSGPGWWSEGTSTGWSRQAADRTSAYSSRVDFDSTVDVMGGLSGSYGQPGTSGPCKTVHATIAPGDPLTPGVQNGAYASLIYMWSPNATNPLYGTRPTMLPKQGDDFWYGYAFQTNAEYTPQTSTSFPNWNTIGMEFHTSIGGYQGPLGLAVATAGPTMRGVYTCGTPLSRLAVPRLEVSLTGGAITDGTNDDATNTCRRWQGPDFVAGHRYIVQMHVKWDAFHHGSLEVWIDGQKVVDATEVSTLWVNSQGTTDQLYPQFQNYRYADNSVSSTNTVYYGGFVRGSNQTDVAIP